METVVGIDVGGLRKGFHAVALRDGLYHDRTASDRVADIAGWCGRMRASVVAVDAPCRWSPDSHARACERELAKARISCFATPTRENARTKPWYEWMRNGEALYELLERDFPLFDGRTRRQRMCIETFPQAVACALAGRIVSAKRKRHERTEVLRSVGLDVSMLPNIDYVDAALCAEAALHLRREIFKAYGEGADGLIVVPATARIQHPDRTNPTTSSPSVAPLRKDRRGR